MSRSVSFTFLPFENRFYMSVRTRYSIIKGVDQESAQKAIADATKLFPGDSPKHSQWSDWTHVVRQKTFDAFVSSDVLVITDDAWLVAKRIAEIVDAPHLELRVQESDHWDFSLYHHGELIADFSTRVAYFDDDPTSPQPWKMGSADAFANAWGIPKDRVLPYLVDWSALPSPKVCREGDTYPTDDWRQVFDFMTALGIEHADNRSDSFMFSLPSWELAYVRQPAWRRAVRKISVWFKGAYPDVPKHTEAAKKEWERRRASVQVVKVDLDEMVNRDRTK